jgi:hypothetical protein
MNWLNKILGSQSPSVSLSFSSTPPEIRRGLPVYESDIQGQKLERRDILVTHNGEQQKIPIDTLRAQFYAGLLPADAPVLVTNFYCQETYFCGEGTVGSVVAAWESAPLETFDQQDVTRMIREFSLPEYEITSKATYSDLKRLYDRCDSYYRYIAGREREFKRLTKNATKDLVFLLDETQPGWDGADGAKRFAEEVRRHHPQLIRTETEKKAKRERDKKQQLKREERRPLIDTRNNLTNFPHKAMQIEVRDHGMVEIRAIKPQLREGTITPETLVRYRPESDWMELCEFLNDWIRNKATDRQIDYLKSLQRQNGITTEIPLDISRQEISDRISALAPKRYDELA